MLILGSRFGARLAFVRRALVSVVVCLAGAGAVGAAGWSLQTVTLPPPARAARIAADASAWLHDYRYSIDVFHSHGRTLRGTCLRGWYHRRGQAGPFVHGSLLVLQGGPVVVDTGGRRYVRFLAGTRRHGLPAFLAIAAGCTSPLNNDLYAAIQRAGHVSVERAFAANQPALALHVPPVRGERLTIYVSPRQYRPLVVTATVGGSVTTARIHLTRATQRVQSHDRRLLERTAVRHA